MTITQADLTAVRAAIEEAQNRLNSALALLDSLATRVEESIPAVPARVTFPTSAKTPETPPVEEPLIITPEWQATLDLLNRGAQHLFVTGGAGVGKSTLLKHYTDHSPANVAIVAPTGVAALRVGGETIHRFFRFGAHALDKDDIRTLDSSDRDKYRVLDTLVIDEVSMVRADLMDAVDLFLRKNGRDGSKPFGGCRLVMFGDLYQLPPVSKEKDEKRWLTQRYGLDCPYFFHAEAWRDAPPRICSLTEIFRQKDETFTRALNAIRNGTLNVLQLALINERVRPSFKAPADELWITLTTTNDSAAIANQRMLDALRTDSRVFEATVSGDFDLKNAPTDDFLELKTGAAVMFIRNNRDGGWMNGTLGRVTSVKPLWVETDSGEHEVDPETWESIAYEFDPDKKRLTKTVKGKFTQIPLKLASAITIHKSQGITLERAIIDLAGGAFAAGQAYVGLSRCRALAGMVLRRPLRMDDLIVSTEVQAFMMGKPTARPAPTPELLPLFAGIERKP